MKQVLFGLIALALVFSCIGCIQSNNSHYDKSEILISSSNENSSSIQDEYVSNSSSGVDITDKEDSETESSGLSGYDDYIMPLVEYVKIMENPYEEDETKNNITENDIRLIKEYPFKVSSTETKTLLLFEVKCYITPQSYRVIGMETDGRYAFTFSGFSPDEITFADIDGDKTDEVVVHSEIPVASSSGPFYVCAIYKWESRDFQSIFQNDYDTGFRLLFKSEDAGVVINNYTGCETPIDTSLLSSQYLRGNLTFEEAFSYNTPIENLFRTFLTFEPADIDGDGIFEILVVQRYGVEKELSYPWVGNAFCALKYDKYSGEFRVTRSAFEQSSRDGYIKDPNNNWYLDYGLAF